MSFNVTKKHIDDWYEENRWWADDLNVEEKIRLCKVFYIYQVVHQQRNPEIEIQTEDTRFNLSKKLAKLLNINQHKELTSAVMPTPPHPSTAKILQPFYSKYQDIERLVKDETVNILKVDSSVLNNIQNDQYKKNINEIYAEIHKKFEGQYYKDDKKYAQTITFTGLSTREEQVKKQLSMLYGYCLAKIAQSEGVTTPCNIPFMIDLITRYGGTCEMITVDKIKFPSVQKTEKNKLIKQMVYHNMFWYYIEKNDYQIPCLVKIYYDIVHNAECLYYGNISSAKHPFFVANRNNREIDIDRKITNPYRTISYISSASNYWDKIKNKKDFVINIQEFNKKLVINNTFEDFLEKYYFTYTTTNNKIVIKYETHPSSSLMKLSEFVKNLTPIRNRSLFDNQLSYFYKYLKSDIDYKTKFTYNDEKGTIREGVFLDKNEITSEIDGQPITFDIFEKYLKGENNIATIKEEMVKKIKNWSNMNDSHKGMDGGDDFNRSDDGMMNDGMMNPAEITLHNAKITQSIINVLHQFQQNLNDNKHIQTINNRDFFIKYCQDPIYKDNSIEEKTRMWDTQGSITQDRLQTINSQFIIFKRDWLDFLSKQPIRPHTVNISDTYDEDAVKDVLLATGLILPPITLEKVSGIVINTLPRTILQTINNIIITVDVSCPSSLLDYFKPTCNYQEIYNVTDITTSVPNLSNTEQKDIIIRDLTDKSYELWKPDDFTLFEKIILYKATWIRQERNKKTWLTTLFRCVPSGKDLFIIVLIVVIAYILFFSNTQQVKKQEIMRLENFTNVTTLNTMSLVDLHHLQKDISRENYGSELIKTFVKKVVECHKLIAIYDHNLLEVSYAYWLLKNHASNKLSFSLEDIEVARKILGENQLFNPDGSLKEFAPILTLQDIDRCIQGAEMSYSKLTDKFPDKRVKLGNFDFTLEHFKILGEGTFQDLDSKETRLKIKSRNIFDILQSGSDIETTKKITEECKLSTFTETLSSSDITEECKAGTFTETTKKMTDEYNDKLKKNSLALVTLTNNTDMMPYNDYFKNFLKLSGKKEEENSWYTQILNFINYYLRPNKTYHKVRFDSSSINYQHWKKMYNEGFTDDNDQIITYQMFFELFKYINSTQVNDDKILKAIQTSIQTSINLRNSSMIEKGTVELTKIGEGLKETIMTYYYPKSDEVYKDEYLTPVAIKAIENWDKNEDNSTSTSTSTSTVEEVPDGGRGRRHKSIHHHHKSKKSIKKYHDGSKKGHKRSSSHKKNSRHKDGKKSKKHKKEEKKKDKKKSRK